MSFIKKTFSSLIIISISCLIGLIIIEVILQFVKDGDGWGATNKVNIRRNFQYQYDISNLYKSTYSKVNYERNKYGLRDDCASTKEIEILTIGGSTTDQIYVPFEHTFQKVLQERMRSINSGFGCVTNAGIDGHSTWGHIFSFEKWFPLIPNLSPNYILLYIGINDTDFKRAEGPKLGYDVLNRSSYKDFLKKFEIVQLLIPIYRYFKPSSDKIGFARHGKKMFRIDEYNINKLNNQTKHLSKINAEAFGDRLKLILNKIKELGATPICVTQPHRYIKIKNKISYGVPNILGEGFSGLDFDYSIKEINLIINNLCGKNTIDLHNHDFSDEHFYDGIHTNEKGSIEIGNTIANFLIKNTN